MNVCYCNAMNNREHVPGIKGCAYYGMITPVADDWRQLDQKQRVAIAMEIGTQALIRYEKGAQEHGEQFIDDPLDQLETELLDGLFYVKMARRQRDAQNG